MVGAIVFAGGIPTDDVVAEYVLTLVPLYAVTLKRRYPPTATSFTSITYVVFVSSTIFAQPDGDALAFPVDVHHHQL